MVEFLKEALSQIPKFLLSFAYALTKPRTFIRDLLKDATSKSLRTDVLSDALIFLAISLLITAALKSVVFKPGAKEEVTALYLAKDAIWKAVAVLTMAGLTRMSWRFVGGRATFEQYVVANCYLFGVFSVLAHIALVSGTVVFGKLPTWQPLTFELYWSAIVAPLSGWTLYCWGVYKDVNGSTTSRSAIALLAVCLLGVPVVALCYGLRFALIGHIYRDFL